MTRQRGPDRSRPVGRAARAGRVARGAFSLAELMVAIGILGIGLLILAAAFPVAFDQTRRAVELTTSQLVFEQAVQQLKLNISSEQLENYIDPRDGAGQGALETSYRLGDPDDITTSRRIYLLSFDTVDLDGGAPADDLFAAFANEDCAYSEDPTYGWLAAVQKIGEYATASGTMKRYYRFWIFVVREKTTVLDGSGGLKVQFSDIQQPTPGVGTITPTFDPPNTPPRRGQSLLGDDGDVYRVLDTTPGSNRVKLDGDAPPRLVYVAGGTRRAPTVQVFQTIISYEE